jgi:hypothetical protein
MDANSRSTVVGTLLTTLDEYVEKARFAQFLILPLRLENCLWK